MKQEIALENVDKLSDGEFLAESIRQWRPDCQAGQFKVGASGFKGTKIDMELIGAQISEGEFFGYPFQRWLALLFVDQDGILSTILYKTESLDNFEELRRSHRIKGQSLLGKTVRACMAKRASRATGESYYAVEFEVVKDGKYAKAIAQFRQQQYGPRYFPDLLGKAANGNENGAGKTDGNGK